MADHTHVGLGNAEEGGDFRARLFVKESDDDDGAFALFEVLHAVTETDRVEAGPGRRDGREAAPELFEQAFFAARVAAEIEDHHAAGTQNKGAELFGLAQAAGAQGFERGDHDLLCEVVGGRFVAQVAQSIETDARRQAAEEFAFRLGVGLGADAADKLGVVDGDIHQHTFYV